MSSLGKKILQLYKPATTKSLLFIPLLILLSLQLYSQSIKRTNNWYFGNYAGVDFNSGEPLPLHDGELDSGNRGIISMSNTIGNLQYYTDGWTLWNKNHVPI